MLHRKKSLLLNMFSRIRKYLLYQLQKQLRPEIIGGFKRSDGKFLKHVRISNTSHLSYTKNLWLEDYVFVGHFTYIDSQIKTIIEEGAQIGFCVSIVNHSSHNSIRIYGRRYVHEKEFKCAMQKGTVKIGRYTFVGPNSIIMPNTEIGEGSIVAAHSLVKGQFPPYSIIKGSPAVVVGDTRKIDEEILEKNPEFRQHYYRNI